VVKTGPGNGASRGSRNRPNKKPAQKGGRPVITENTPDSKSPTLFQADALQKMLVTSLSKALYMDESDVNVESPFIDMGLDSIVGVEWVKAINDQFNTSIIATAVYDYTNLYEFSRYLEKVIRTGKAEKTPGVEMAD